MLNGVLGNIGLDYHWDLFTTPRTEKKRGLVSSPMSFEAKFSSKYELVSLYGYSQ